MSIDLTTETIITTAEVAQSLPRSRNDRPVHISAIIRWIQTGAKGPDGQRVRLEAVRVGGRWLTSREALQRFAERLTPRVDDQLQPARTPSQAAKASEQASRRLNSMGV